MLNFSKVSGFEIGKTYMAITIDVWSDYLCPYCFVTSKSLALLKKHYAVNVQYHMYELPRTKTVPALDKRQTLLDIMRPHFDVEAKRDYGLTINQGPNYINSRPALIATKVAAARARAHHYYHSIMRAYWEQGRDISQTAVLVEAAVEVGLDSHEFKAALRSPGYVAALAADMSHAHYYEVNQVPTVMVNGDLRLVGAQPYDALQSAIVELSAGSAGNRR